MENLIVLGTGNALATKCYNTCFALRFDEGTLLVDAGGGNGILSALESTGIELEHLHHMIVTHAHCDHLLGVVWVIRKIATSMHKGKYTGEFSIYCHDELAKSIQTLCQLTLQKKFTDLFHNRILFIPVSDGSCNTILNRKFTFFDIHSTKAEQYGFSLCLSNNKTLVCLGDEPYNALCAGYVQNCEWMLAEAFCLYAHREQFQPYEKHHSTVKDACVLAETLDVKNLVLWHTEDKNYENRQTLYIAEGSQYYHGNLLVPYDHDIITLS